MMESGVVCESNSTCRRGTVPSYNDTRYPSLSCLMKVAWNTSSCSVSGFTRSAGKDGDVNEMLGGYSQGDVPSL